MLNGDEGASFNLIPAWIDKVEGLDDTTTPFFFVEMADSGRFEAIFVMLGPIRSTLNTLRPFYALADMFPLAAFVKNIMEIEFGFLQLMAGEALIRFGESLHTFKHE
jgi:hypothetical protein